MTDIIEKKKRGRPKGSKNKYTLSHFKKKDYIDLLNFLESKGENQYLYWGDNIEMKYAKFFFTAILKSDYEKIFECCDDYDYLVIEYKKTKVEYYTKQFVKKRINQLKK